MNLLYKSLLLKIMALNPYGYSCYGAIPDKYDSRDYKKVYDPADIPPRHHYPLANADLRKYIDQVYDQRNIESCTANALCSAYAMDLKKQSKTSRRDHTRINPSRLFLYYNARKNPSHDTGASIRDTIKALNRYGLCRAVLWPYYASRVSTEPSGECYDDARGNTLHRYERLNHDLQQFRACLKDNCPFVFGFKVYKSFYKAAICGEMPMPTSAEKRREPEGSHAVVAVGYDDKRQRIIVLNSWGSIWGNGGYFFMPYNFIKDTKMCFDFWKISFVNERA